MQSTSVCCSQRDAAQHIRPFRPTAPLGQPLGLGTCMLQSLKGLKYQNAPVHLQTPLGQTLRPALGEA